MKRPSALVLGLGRFGGGLATVQHLARHAFAIRVADRATAEQLRASVATLRDLPRLDWRLGPAHRPADLLDGIDLLVCNPAIPESHPVLELARNRGVPITQEINLVLESYPGTVVVVTGTNGKSTTATLLAHALRRSGHDTLLGGNIGHSLLDDHRAWQPTQVAVLELSSFQLERVDPDRHQVAGTVFTRITSDHLDRHGDLATYQAAKSRAAAMARDFIVCAETDTVARSFVRPDHAVFLHGQQPDRQDPDSKRQDAAARLSHGLVQTRLASGRQQTVFATAALELPGCFQTENAMAAYLAARRLGASHHESALAIVTTAPLTHRLQLAARVGGRQIFGNAISTQIDSTVSALDSLPGPVHWVGGGKSKDDRYEHPGRLLSRRVASAHLFGRAGPRLAGVMAARVTTTVHQHLEAALDAAWAACQDGDSVLFSPAFASFDQFPNFAARAHRFEQWVRSLREQLAEPNGGNSS